MADHVKQREVQGHGTELFQTALRLCQALYVYYLAERHLQAGKSGIRDIP